VSFMTAEQILQTTIGGLVMQLAVLQAEVQRLQALIPAPKVKSTEKGT